MKRISGILSLLLMSYLTIMFSNNTSAQNLRLYGFVDDINSKKPIEGASLYAFIDNRKKLVTNSDKEGKFTLEYPNDGSALLIEKQGYRSLSIPAAGSSDAKSTNPFFVQIPLIPLDQQASDRPYLQSEQKDFVLTTSDTKTQQVTRLFKIKDALTSHTIESASICFDYTKTVKKECRDITRETPSQTMTFKEADIVNMVVESAGYQTYRGNLILDKMDGSNSVYEVKLAPEVTIFTILVNTSAAVNCLLSATGGNDILMTKGASNSFYTLGKTGDFLFRVSNNQGVVLHSENITIHKGLNYRTITINSPSSTLKSKATASRPEPKLPAIKPNVSPLPDTVKNITLYFHQSEHKLLPEAQEKLNQLSLWLLGKPERRIKISGHSDNVGDARRNEVLSEYRARVTYNYLLQQGVPYERMLCTWSGGKKPVEKNDSEENKRKNRRVEITLIPQ